MGERDIPAVGTVAWADLTVDDADGLREFYAAVTGWRPEPVNMGGYVDFNMCRPGDGAPAAGVCHARGVNANLPPQWLIYVVVADLDASLAVVRKHGGEVLAEPSVPEGERYAVVRDPAGAALALYQVG
ncbi:MAG: VOC family protein [Acidobacteriota bacterium]